MAPSSCTSRTSTARRLTALLAAAALVPGLAGCGGDDGAVTATQETAASTPTDAPESTTPAACTTVEAPEPRGAEGDESAPRPARLAGAWTVTMTTNCGSFTIELDTERQPRTSASFKALAAGGFYDGLTFHRIAAGFVIQGGDPAGDGTGGPGYSVDETPPADAAYTRGVVAMAKTGDEPAGTSGSQFYVVTADDSGLPPDYAIVGRVTSGMESVDRIAAVGSDGSPADTPLQPVVIEKATARKG